jgi:hypothetical protein
MMRITVRFRGIVAVALFLLTIVSTVTAKYSGGTGEPNDPYQIATAADLIALGESPADYDKHFVLTADIDLDPNLPGRKVFDRAVIAPHTGGRYSSPFEGRSFNGVLDGNNRVISCLTIIGGNRLGLFGKLGSAGRVHDLGVVNVNVVGSGHFVGGLVGDNHGDVSASYGTGSVRGTGRGVGGLVGTNGDEWDAHGRITGCHSAGEVSGAVSVGGVAGENCGSMTVCYSTATVGGTREGTGGLVGGNSGCVILCYSAGAVSGCDYVGGLVGGNGGSVAHCYSIGPVSGTGTGGTGGLVGQNGSMVTGCYSIGTVTGRGEAVGGLTGNNYGDVSMCFWNIETSGMTRMCATQWVDATGCSDEYGKTTAQMQDLQTYRDAGWDFTKEITDGTSDVWEMPQGSGYPTLAIFNGYEPPQLRGTGTAEDPYLIHTPAELGAVAYYSPFVHYRLAASIDLSGVRWGTAVIPWFAGTLDGNGLSIADLTIRGGSHLALFAQLALGAEVKRLAAAGVNIDGSGNYVGGLVAENWGAVAECFGTGAVCGDRYVGGLVGANGGHVARCYSKAAVTGGSIVGGFVGQNGLYLYSGDVGSVVGCYSTGLVSGNEVVGGFAGQNPAMWWWGFLTNCFWDTQTSGQTVSAGGTGKTTTEMQMAKTFLDAGWDFVGETANGTEDIWWILEGTDYPRLWWELGEDDAAPPDHETIR